MTYCVGVILEQGLVLAADTRTNAGVDQVAISPKMHTFEVKNERVIVLLTSGNLAITQSVINRLKTVIDKTESENTHLHNVTNLFDTASLVGAQLRTVFERDDEHFKSHEIDFNASTIVAGQIKGEKPRLFHIYATGNFIKTCVETLNFQIGETQYGKPIVDRVVKYASDIMDVVKRVLNSFDSIIRSNVSVAAPIDLLIYRTDSFHADCKQRMTENNSYYLAVRQGWGAGLKQVFSALPSPDWC